MPTTSLDDLYQQKLGLIADAERQALAAYPEMLDMVGTDALRQALQTHMQETQQQLDQVQSLVSQQGTTRDGGATTSCMSMQALIEEARTMAGQITDADTRDAFLIGAAQAMEHHEIAAYGTACAWARQLGREQDAEVLDRILDEEKRTDALLTELAEGRVNAEAAQGA